MFSPTYQIARSVENVSVRCGWGTFELGGDGWKCIECQHHDKERDLCAQCRKAWLHEVGHIEYSDVFERRMNIIIGNAGLVLGVCSWVGNARWGWWDIGAAFTVMSEFFQAYLPSFFSWTIFSSLLIFVLVSSLLTVIGGYCIILFLMISNPTAKRHWRHMTAPMYLVLAAQMVIYVLFMMWGVTVAELAFVLGPIAIGTGGLLAAACMRKREAGHDEEEGVLKLGGERDKLREV